MSAYKIPIYVIKLKVRTDTLSHIREVFNTHNDFDVVYFKAIRDNVGAVFDKTRHWCLFFIRNKNALTEEEVKSPFFKI